MSFADGRSVILFFIDGLGIGTRGEHNPLSEMDDIAPLAHFTEGDTEIPFDGVLAVTDPRLGVEGRPQSASGQTTILTGVNAPKAIGYHKHGFPNAQLREIISERSIFRRLRDLGAAPNIFANTYTPAFFDKPPRWKSASTVAVEAADMTFNRLPDLLGGFSLFHDFTNQVLRDRGFEVPLFSAVDSAAVLARLAECNRFVMYEHFLTDKIGHDQDVAAARDLLPILSEFVRETLKAMDHSRTTLILTSDHGNIEDLSVRNHTLNDVPTIVWGRKKEETAASIGDLTHMTPAIIDPLTT
jgi:hypothetical protein